MGHVLESDRTEETDMPGTSIRTTVAPNGKRIIAIGRAMAATSCLNPLKVAVSDGDGRIAVSRRPSSDVLANGAHRRFFWRVNHRFGCNWSRMTDAQIRREMRMMSNRRAH
jgi:hypothetical protein